MTQSATVLTPPHSALTDPMLGRTVLGRYRVIKPLAHGGMGVVYLGRTEGAEGFSKPVVIKRVLPQLVADPNMTKMFVREARILSNLHHPGIVGVVDFGEEDQAYVMVLDYVHGYDAGAWLLHLKRRSELVPRSVAIQITIRVLEALHYAHTLKRPDGTPMQVVHRDISPGNILLDTEGHVRLLDFGIARIANEANEYRTQETTFKGKLGYAHPTLLARGEPCPETDVYSTAVVLFQMLAGINPFRGNSTADTLGRIVTQPLPRLRQYLPDAPAELENVLLRAMSRDLANGYGSAANMAEALRKVRGETEAALNTRMAEVFSSDFREMPGILDLEPLEARDAAWRTSILDLEPAALRSTPPRAPDAGSEPPTVFAPPPAATPTLVGDPTVVQTPEVARGQRWIAIAIGGVAVALVAVAVALLWKRETPPAEARYVVVTKTESEATTAETETEPTESVGSQDEIPTAASAAEATQKHEASPAPRAKEGASSGNPGGAAVKPSAQLLTQRFSRHQGRIQGCFTSHPDLAKQNPNLQIAFKVATNGSVQQATLIPSALASTSLGACVLRIARSANFGNLTESASFRIPVQARVQ